MDIRFLSRNAESAVRIRNDVQRRGLTYNGDKIWDADELNIIRSTAHLKVADAQKSLPHRSSKSIERRREMLGLSKRTLKSWTTTEDRILRQNIDRLDYVAIAKLLPGRNRHAVQGRAWYLGVRKGCLRSPMAKGLPIYDDVRNRAFEDGLSMRALDCELKTGKYFQDNWQKRLNWKKLAKAVEFFGGTMKIDWQDV